MAEFNGPQWIRDLNSTKLWSLDFAHEKFPDAEWFYYICEKTDDGYLLHGLEYDTSDAFTLRRELVKKLGTKKLFIRAKRKPEQTFSNDSDESLDACRDYFNEGRSVNEVPVGLQSAFRAFCRSHGRSAR